MGKVAEAVRTNDLFRTGQAPLRHGRTTGGLSNRLLPDSREPPRAGRRVQTSSLDPDYYDSRVQSPHSRKISASPPRSGELRSWPAGSKYRHARDLSKLGTRT